MFNKDPRLRQGSCQRTRGKGSGKGEKGKTQKRVAVFLCWGISIGFFLINQPLVVKANGPSQTNDEIPEKIIEYCEIVGAEYNICPELLEAICYRESRFTADAKNGKCIGIMQVNIAVHTDRIEKYGWITADMTDPYKNITIAADYLAELYEQYGDENPIVLAAYNGNTKAINKYKEYGIMCEYAEDILTRSAEYERIHGK